MIEFFPLGHGGGDARRDPIAADICHKTLAVRVANGKIQRFPSLGVHGS